MIRNRTGHHAGFHKAIEELYFPEPSVEPVADFEEVGPQMLVGDPRCAPRMTALALEMTGWTYGRTSLNGFRSRSTTSDCAGPLAAAAFP